MNTAVYTNNRKQTTGRKKSAMSPVAIYPRQRLAEIRAGQSVSPASKRQMAYAKSVRRKARRENVRKLAKKMGLPEWFVNLKAAPGIIKLEKTIEFHRLRAAMPEGYVPKDVSPSDQPAGV